MLSAITRRLALVLLVAVAPAMAGVGRIDAGFSPFNQGFLRIAHDLGGAFEYVNDVRTLDDGRVMAVGVAYTGSQWHVAASVRLANGDRDVAVNPLGRYDLLPSGGIVGSFNTAAAIAPDGSYYVVGASGNELRVWRYAIDGTLLGGPFPFATLGRELRADSALVDAQGRLLVGGRSRLLGFDDMATDAFVLRMRPDGSLDPEFGLRELAFESLARDDAYRLREVGDGGYLVCSRVGDLDGSLLGYGLARLTETGDLHPEFNAGSPLVHFLTVDGLTLGAACNDIGVLRTSTVLRFYVTGRAYRPGQDARSFVRVHQGDGSVLESFGSGGQVLLDFGTNGHVDGFPHIAVGRSSDDIGRAYVVSSALLSPFDPATRSVLATRLNSLGSVDTGWGESSGITVVPFSLPDPQGTQRPHDTGAMQLSPDGLLLGGTVELSDASRDWTLVRLTGYRSFRDGFE